MYVWCSDLIDSVCSCLQAYNLSDPSGFFEDISAVPTLANRTIISVHVYGPNITVRAVLMQKTATSCVQCRQF